MTTGENCWCLAELLGRTQFGEFSEINLKTFFGVINVGKFKTAMRSLETEHDGE